MTIRFSETTEPSTPPSGKAWIYVDSADKDPKIKDDTGSVRPLIDSAAIATHAALTSGVHGISVFGATLVDDADATAARATLGLVIGTDVQAYDAELAALAGLTSAADKGIQFTGTGTAATYDLTAAGKALLDDADASAQRTTLGLGSFATISSLAHSSLSDLTSGDDHTQYALLAGRAGGQSYTGGTGSGENLTLSSTANATKGKINLGASSAFDEVNTRLGIGTTSPIARLHAISTTEQLRLGYDASNYMSATVSSVGVVTFDAVGTGSTSFSFSDRIYSGLPSSLNDFRVGTTSNWTQTTGSYAAFSGQINGNPTASSTAIVYGTHMEVGVASGNAQNLTGAQALIGIRTGCQHRGTGVVNGMVNFFAASAGFSSSGSITSSYGLWINPQIVAGVTNGYGIYQTGSSDRNYFAGTMSIGTTATPTARFHVVSTTQQVRVGFDASNYYSTTVSSGGLVTFDAVGASAGFSFSDSITLADAKDIIVNTTTGTKIGTGITQKLGFYNATPIAQRAGAAQAAVVTTSATNIAPFGFTTGAQADAIVTLVNELRDWAVAQGFIKGAA